MKKRLHVIASCADRKARAIPRRLRLQDLPKSVDSLEDVIGRWSERLANVEVEAVEAGYLYQGDHWSVVRTLPQCGSSFNIELWVASAGYGLIHATNSIKPYSATFSRRQPDSIHRFEFGDAALAQKSRSRAWWDSLTKCNAANAPSESIESLARNDPGSWLMVVAGPQYLRAMARDLAAGAKLMRDQERLLIISSTDASLPESLRNNWIPSKATLQSRLGGARTSLHARVAADILASSKDDKLRASQVRQDYLAELSRSPTGHRTARRQLGDGAVRSFIKGRLDRDRTRSFTSLLRELRGNDLACEQSRFRRIYTEVRGA